MVVKAPMVMPTTKYERFVLIPLAHTRSGNYFKFKNKLSPESAMGCILGKTYIFQEINTLDAFILITHPAVAVSR